MTERSGGVTLGSYYSPVIKIEGKTYVLAKLDGGEYVIDYDNFKTANTETVRYLPATSVDQSSELLVEELSKYFTAQNSLIFKDIPEAITISQVLGDDEVVTDTAESGSTTDEAYDNAKDETKDDEVQSSDGRPKCHTH